MIENLILGAYGATGLYVMIAISVFAIGVLWSLWNTTNSALKAIQSFSTLDRIMIGVVFIMAAAGIIGRILFYVEAVPK